MSTPESVNDDAQDRLEQAVDFVAGAFEPRTVEVIGQGQVTFIRSR